MKKNEPVQEKRKSVRFHILSLVKHATEPNVVTFQVTNIQNVSRGGLSFVTEQEIKEGATLQLHFLPPNREKPVDARGKIVRCLQITKNEKAFEVGIQFLDVSEDARRAIQEMETFLLEDQKKIRS